MNIRSSYTQKWLSDPPIHERTEDHITDSQSKDAVEWKMSDMNNHSRCGCHIQSFHTESCRNSISESDFHRSESLTFADKQNEYQTASWSHEHATHWQNENEYQHELFTTEPKTMHRFWVWGCNRMKKWQKMNNHNRYDYHIQRFTLNQTEILILSQIFAETYFWALQAIEMNSTQVSDHMVSHTLINSQTRRSPCYMHRTQTYSENLMRN